MSTTLGSSSEEQAQLRVIALWAVAYAEKALLVFEARHPDDTRPREAIEAARHFGEGKKRDNALRMAAFAAMKAGKETDEPSKYAVQAAVAAAAVAYTHTDLQTGVQGVRQARHLLGPIVYAALALETASDGATDGDAFVREAAKTAPPEVVRVLKHMPPQPEKKGRPDTLFFVLDTLLRH